ncbi:MAG: PLD nuclease N-terminal domain-containing protein [Opitutaceae bacterium]
MEMQEATGIFILIQILFFVGFFLFGLLGLAFWIWMLIDCLKYEKSEGNDKLIWVLVLVLTNWIGALIYFFVRRPERKRMDQTEAAPPELSKAP